MPAFPDGMLVVLKRARAPCGVVFCCIGIKTIIVSDPTTESAAAALCVEVCLYLFMSMEVNRANFETRTRNTRSSPLPSASLPY